MKKAIILAAACLLLCGCGAAEPASVSFFAMDTFMRVSSYSGNTAAAESARDAVLSLEKDISVTDDKSELSRANRNGGGQLSARTLGLLQRAADINVRTDGALDITLYPISREWGFTTGEYNIPDDERISELLENTGTSRISFTENGIVIPDGMMTDLGAVGKGYAAELAAEALKSTGETSALADLGGNILAIGARPDGSPWRIGVRDPDSEGYIGVLEITDKFVSTSGDYERYFTGEDGTRYCHIIDPKTGRPARSGLSSATVIGTDGVLCDGLSTAFFVMGYEKTAEYLRENGGVDVLLITDDGKIYITGGISGSFFLSEGYSEREITVIPDT